MNVDRRQALDAFQEYVAAYDPSNPRIALKIDHTQRVAQLCERVALSEGCSKADADLAWLLGLLHDIGRFEQVRRYNTYNDAASVSHAALGAEVLFSEEGAGKPLVRAFVRDVGSDALIRTAVALHSDFRLPKSLDERTRFFCNVVRDADKIDIVRVNCAYSVQDIYGVSAEDMARSPLSPECVELFYQHSCLPRNVRRYPADILLGHICFAWELVFRESRRIMIEQGYLQQMLRHQWTNEETRVVFEAIERHMLTELTRMSQ